MYGFDTLVLGVSSNMTEKPNVIDRKSGPGRMMNEHHNTTVSAVSVLDDTGLSLYHNLFAAIPLAPETFKGIAVRQFALASKRLGEFVEWAEIA